MAGGAGTVFSMLDEYVDTMVYYFLIQRIVNIGKHTSVFNVAYTNCETANEYRLLRLANI